MLGPLGRLCFWGPKVNKFQDPETKMPTNAVGYLMIFVLFSFQIMGIKYNFNKAIIMGILLMKLKLS